MYPTALPFPFDDFVIDVHCIDHLEEKIFGMPSYCRKQNSKFHREKRKSGTYWIRYHHIL